MPWEGWHYPKSAAQKTYSDGDTDWVNIENIKAADGRYASIDVSGYYFDSHWLYASNFGFDSSVELYGGFEVEAYMRDSAYSGCRPPRICYDDDPETDSEYTDSGSWTPGTAWTTLNMGDRTKLPPGGATGRSPLYRPMQHTGSLVGATNFGVALTVYGSGSSSYYSYIDYIKMRAFASHFKTVARYPGTVKTLEYDTEDWNDKDNIKADDTSYASLWHPLGETKLDYIIAYNFGFVDSDIPAGAVIDGFIAEVEYWCSSTSGYGFPAKGYIIKDASSASAPLSDYVYGHSVGYPVAYWPQSGGSDIVGEFGTCGDLCNQSWSESDILSSDFGIGFGGDTPGGAGQWGWLQFVRMTVYYSFPALGVYVNDDKTPSRDWLEWKQSQAEALKDEKTAKEALKGENLRRRMERRAVAALRRKRRIFCLSPSKFWV